MHHHNIIGSLYIRFKDSRYGIVISLERKSDGLSETLLDWPTVSQKFAWNIVLLLGAGFAMAKAAKVHGTSLTVKTSEKKFDHACWTNDHVLCGQCFHKGSSFIGFRFIGMARSTTGQAGQRSSIRDCIDNSFNAVCVYRGHFKYSNSYDLSTNTRNFGKI